jgi:Dyp-type peroxidase family
MDFQDVQGNITPGFKKDHQAFVSVTFADAAGGRDWLTAVLPEIARSSEVSSFKQLFKMVTDRLNGEDLAVVSARWTNIGLSWQGLGKLGAIGSRDPFPPVFKANRVPLTPQQGDAGPDALLLLAADRVEDIEADLARHRELLERTRCVELRTFRGNTLPGERRGTEQFGFKDLISDPIVAGTPEAAQPGATDIVPASAFILDSSTASGTPDLQRNGSYLAFVELAQDVATFWNAMQQQAQRSGTTADRLADQIVGRHADGTAISDPPPRLSHIGRARPQWLGKAAVNQHRILRRGIPYGPPLPKGAPDDGRKRGLLFLAYQADLTQQFEQLWVRWLNGAAFPGPGAGTDALVGQPTTAGGSYSNGSGDALRDASYAPRDYGGPSDLTIRLSLPQFVRPGYGGYFFSPGINALAQLTSASKTTAMYTPLTKGR